MFNGRGGRIRPLRGPGSVNVSLVSRASTTVNLFAPDDPDDPTIDLGPFSVLQGEVNVFGGDHGALLIGGGARTTITGGTVQTIVGGGDLTVAGGRVDRIDGGDDFVQTGGSVGTLQLQGTDSVTISGGTIDFIEAALGGGGPDVQLFVQRVLFDGQALAGFVLGDSITFRDGGPNDPFNGSRGVIDAVLADGTSNTYSIGGVNGFLARDDCDDATMATMTITLVPEPATGLVMLVALTGILTRRGSTGG